jgi:hypothetical protein
MSESMSEAHLQLVERATSLVWPVEEKYVRWSLTKIIRTNTARLDQRVKYDGIVATAFSQASAFWAALGGVAIVLALPLTIVGIEIGRSGRLCEALGFLLYFIALGLLCISILRKGKYRTKRANFRSS